MKEVRKNRSQEVKQISSLHTLAPCGRGQGEGLCGLPRSLRSLAMTNKKQAPIPTFPHKGRSNTSSLVREDRGGCQSNKVAFTLAEVLITLGIIGIVAAMTMPALITKYRKIQTVSRLKKVYSVLNQALDNAKVTNGIDINNWYLPDTDMSAYFAENYLLPYLKISYNCAKDSNSTCNYNLNPLSKNCGPGGTYMMQYSNSYPFILADGSIISIRAFKQEHIGVRLQVFIDINGKKRPNVMGIDGFLMELVTTDRNKFLPYAYTKYSRNDYIGNKIAEEGRDQTGCNIEYGSGARCFALIMHDGWEIKDDYPWR